MIPQERPVKFETKIALLKRSPTLLSLGLVFTLLPILLTILFSAIFSGINVNEDVKEVDYEKISESGILTSGTITEIATQYNFTMNDEHPSIISYKYVVNSETISSKFRTLAPDRVNRLNFGDKIEVKYLNNDSIIVGFEPFIFPMMLFYSIPAWFLAMGLPIVFYLLITTRRDLNIYKYGLVADAELISMTAKTGSPLSGYGRGVNVHYQYKTSMGRQVLNESFINDLSFLNSKKQGDIIKIFVDRDNESRSCLIPKLEAVRNNWEIEV